MNVQQFKIEVRANGALVQAHLLDPEGLEEPLLLAQTLHACHHESAEVRAAFLKLVQLTAETLVRGALGATKAQVTVSEPLPVAAGKGLH